MKMIAVCLACLVVPQESQRRAESPRSQQKTTENAAQQEQVFSGPQKGEKLPPLRVRLIGQDQPTDVIAANGENPMLLVFFHKLTRPAFGLTRALAAFGDMRKKDKLKTVVVFLVEDETASERRISGIARLLPKSVQIGISPDGLDGPGAYGLNRNVTLTVIAAEKRRVVSNFGLVQPGAQADAPKIMKSVVGMLGSGKVPDVSQLMGGNRRRPPRRDAKLDRMLKPLVEKDLTDEEVKKQIAEIEEYVAKGPLDKMMLGLSVQYSRQELAAIPNEIARKKVIEWGRAARPMMRNQNQRQAAPQQDPQIRPLLQPFIQKSATDEEVVAAAKKIEDYAAKNPVAKGQIGDICRRIISAGKLSNYGTPKCQKYMEKWAVDFHPPKGQPRTKDRPKREAADAAKSDAVKDKAKSGDKAGADKV